MRSLFAYVSALALCAFTAAAVAAPAAPTEGVEYLTLPEVQNTEAGNKVEVIEFFAYSCPHCHAFEPVLSEWVKKQGDKIVFKRVHVSGGPRMAPQQRLFYSLAALGLVGQYHDQVFAAMHGDARLRLADDEQVFSWATQTTIDRVKFIDAYRSFGVTSKLSRADAMMASYRVDSWPMLAVAGRYMTSPYQASQGAPGRVTEAQQQQAALQVLDHLVAKAAADKK
jgi:thiol:disulfide interchange protein DsbA